MAGLLEVAQAADNVPFIQRVVAAGFQVAQEVRAEPADTPDHERRLYLAGSVSREPEVMLSQFVWLCAATPVIRDSVTVDTAGAVTVGCPDSDIVDACRAAWNTVAGI
jgi:hypothetical protein